MKETFTFVSLIMILIITSCQQEETIKIYSPDYYEYAYKHDQQFAYFKAKPPYENFRKKIEYDKFGHPISIFQYNNIRLDTLHGPWIQFYVSGNIRASGYYSNGRKVGAWKRYFDGKLNGEAFIESEEYFVNDIQHGDKKFYHENGALFAYYNYEMGLKDGIIKKYMPDGIQIFEEFYNKGTLIYQKEWYPNSNERLYAEYEINGNEKLKIAYDEKGRKRLEARKLKNGKIKSIAFDASGNIVKEELWEE